MYIRENRRERSVIEKYTAMGFDVLTKGYPDLCFFNDKEVRFVEVKRKQKRRTPKMGLSGHQRKMIEIFKRLELSVSVEYVN